jgi:hypothetical protein
LAVNEGVKHRNRGAREGGRVFFKEAGMIQLRNKDTGALLGTISEEQLEFLIDQLEEEFEEDQDYYINRETITLLEERGADPLLLELLNRAMGDKPDMEIVWSRS